uniref:Toxin candidate TRINITY_DN14899_c0_g1_i1 n=1 Tax=Ceriantheomorphe brasiliensis TaxID=1048506 RepID=A0A7G7WZ09_9CNID|nr:toxin candidate TRINITY_DN14899_c0_g1_i1 [Ceriantheomorphe brasiliensis]
MPGDRKISLCFLFASAFLLLSAESRYFKNIENQDNVAGYFRRRAARNSIQFQRELTKVDDHKDSSWNGEDENGVEDQIKRNFESELPPWYDMKENPDFRLGMEKPRKHREFDTNELRRLEDEFLAKTRELEKKNSGLPKRYDQRHFLRDLEEMDKAKSDEKSGEIEARKRNSLDNERENIKVSKDDSMLRKREERDELKENIDEAKRDENSDVFAAEKRGNVEAKREDMDTESEFLNSIYNEELKDAKKSLDKDSSQAKDAEMSESKFSRKMVDEDQNEYDKDEEFEEPEEQTKVTDAFSLQCEQLIEGVELGEAEKECCSKQSTCPVVSFMGILGHTCFCDKEFYNCLRTADTSLAQDLGAYYFNEMGNKCFTYEEKQECQGEDCLTVQMVDAIDPPKF